MKVQNLSNTKSFGAYAIHESNMRELKMVSKADENKVREVIQRNDDFLEEVTKTVQTIFSPYYCTKNNKFGLKIDSYFKGSKISERILIENMDDEPFRKKVFRSVKRVHFKDNAVRNKK